MKSPELRYERLEGSKGLRFARIDYLADQYMPVHFHDDRACLVLCLTGAIKEVCEGRALAHEPGTVRYMPIGTPHANHFASGVGTFLVTMDREWLERWHLPTFDLNRPASYPGGLTAWCAARMSAEFQNRDALSPMVLEGMLQELLAAMVRDANNTSDGRAPAWLQETRDYLHAHFQEPLTMETIAAVAGVHPAHLMRVFRRHFRCSVGDYVRALRLDYTRHLLTTTVDPLSRIAVAAGFADQSHFSRAFKDHNGLSPAAYRKRFGNATAGQSALR